jgi:hypothetical protein
MNKGGAWGSGAPGEGWAGSGQRLESGTSFGGGIAHSILKKMFVLAPLAAVSRRWPPLAAVGRRWPPLAAASSGLKGCGDCS